MFIDRVEELAFLNRTLTRTRPGPAQLLLLYGRRRIGKTALLHHWGQQSGLPMTYWMAEKEPAPLQRRKLFAAIEGVSEAYAPVFPSWSALWAAVAERAANQRRILVLDELPYAMESDTAMLSALQLAWDQHFERSNLVLALCGSQIRTMELIQGHQSPLFGRLTGQWYLRALPFSALAAFLPGWSIEERIAASAIVGGVPAYLGWLDPQLSLVENVRQTVLDPGSMFAGEPMLMLYDEVREPQPHLAILKAIGSGAHTVDAIANAALISKSHLSAYLMRLQDLKLVERRLPATVPTAERLRSRKGRYHLSDPFFRFYFRFIAPNQTQIQLGSAPIWNTLQHDLRAFVGLTAFEDLARQWVQQAGMQGRLGFVPEVVGSHWSRSVQADVVAINWHERAMLIGECKWGGDVVDRQVVRDLVERTGPLVVGELPGEGRDWRVQYACFARAGFTDAARSFLQEHQGIAVDLEELERGLP
jgi:uncharacterized protein